MAVTTEVRAGLPGGLRLILLRFLALLILTLPVAYGAREGIASDYGQDPRIAEQGLTLNRVIEIRNDLPSSFLGAAVCGLVLFVLFDQLLTASALMLLEGGEKRQKIRVWRTVWEKSWRHFLPFLRLFVVGIIAVALGFLALKFPLQWLGDRAMLQGWRGSTWALVVGVGSALFLTLWFHAVGSLTRWCRVLMVADGRRRVRRAFLLAIRTAWRSPIRTFLYFMLIPILVQLLGGALLAPRPQSVVEMTPWLTPEIKYGIWAAYLLLQSVVWYLLLHRARLMIAENRFDTVRAFSDEPFLSSLFGGKKKARSRKATPGAAPGMQSLNLDDDD